MNGGVVESVLDFGGLSAALRGRVVWGVNDGGVVAGVAHEGGGVRCSERWGGDHLTRRLLDLLLCVSFALGEPPHAAG